MIFPNADAICEIKDPLDWNDMKCGVMVAACRELAIFHDGHSPDLKHIYRRRNFDPQAIHTEKDLERLPFVGVDAMKYYLLLSLPPEKAVLKLTSSGTRGQKTQIWFDTESLRRVQSQLDVLWEQENLTSNEPSNYVNFIFDPSDAGDLGNAFSVQNEQRFAPVKESYFCVHKNSAGAWEFRRDEAVTKLREFEAQGRPVRIGGMPSFIYELLVSLKDEKPIRLPPGSMMMTGGGWKAAEDRAVTREHFRAMVTAKLGIREDRIRDGYGIAEHAAPYVTCRNHRFHVPVYNRVFPRNPVTLEVLPPGEIGLLEFITPFNAMMPNLAVLSTDLGYLDPTPCPCGRLSPTFTLVGRGGVEKHKGCAIAAGDIVR